MAPHLPRPDRRRRGFTLVEMLIAVAILGLVVGMFLPRLESNVPDQLAGAIHVVASDLQYARELAVSNSSKYRLTFDPANNQYELTHRGTNTALDDLPPSVLFTDTTSSDGQPAQVFDLDDLPHSGAGVEVYAVLRSGAVVSPAILEFDSLGETGTSSPTTIWFRGGANDATRYQAIEVSPITGLVTVGELTASSPL